MAKYRISRVYGEIRRNWFFSQLRSNFLETVKRPLAHVLSFDRGPGHLANGVEKSEIRFPVFGVQWVKFGKNANFQTKNAHFKPPYLPQLRADPHHSKTICAKVQNPIMDKGHCGDHPPGRGYTPRQMCPTPKFAIFQILIGLFSKQ